MRNYPRSSESSSSRRHGYPRPQLEREHWESLNGPWDFALDSGAAWTCPEQVDWKGQIQVPFSPETPTSGVEDTGFFRACWYRRELVAPALAPGQRLVLHFGAVDHAATVWVNGSVAARHEGGYTPFQVDITDFLREDDPQVLVVRAEDDPHDLAQPRGKQDWLREPHSIWYPRTTGIWQTVWLEVLGPTSIRSLRWTPSVERWDIGLEVRLQGERRDGLRLQVKLQAGGKVLAEDTYSVRGEEVQRRIALPDPGIEDARQELLWSP
ncbi:MAG: glycoside hydrolase family 2, partial [Planctomycetes bacterium]|nr:glycoside hydrolase family 2 [Planctomycetota bacterium]